MQINKPALARQTYMIGSGKGGVGKSTVTLNLAVALSKLGAKVGVLDADLYGPSIPIMMGLRKMSPRTANSGGGEELLVPFSKFGIKVMSIGFLMEEARSVLWRGPMLHGTLERLIFSVEWGELDFLLIDLPPGTGDVPISLSQMLAIDGALVVSTPQEVAMLDAIKAINAFYQLEIPLIGIVENMAGFTDPQTGVTHHIFGQGKALELAQKFDTDLLASIPLVPAIRRSGDDGCPAAFQRTADGEGSFFFPLAREVLQRASANNHAARLNPRAGTHAR